MLARRWTALRLFQPLELGSALRVYLSVTGVVRGLGIVRGIVLLWLMSKREWGGYQLGLLVAHGLMPVLGVGLHEGFLRFVPQYEAAGQLRAFLRITLAVAVGIALASGIALMWAAPWVASASIGSVTAMGGATLSAEAAERLARSVGLSVIGLLLFHIVQCCLRGRRLFGAVSAMELIGVGGFTVIALCMGLVGVDDGALYLDVYAVISGLCGIGFGTVLLLTLPQPAPSALPGFPAGAFGDLMRYSVWAGMASSCWQLILAFPAWWLNYVSGAEVFATFGGMRLWTQVGLVACAAMSTAVASIVTSRWEQVGREAALQLLGLSTRVALLLMLVVCLALSGARNVIIHLFRSDYHDGVAVVGTLLLYHLQLGMMTFLVVRLTLVKRSTAILWCWIIGGIVIVAATALWVPNDTSAVDALQRIAWTAVAGTTAATVAALVSCWHHRVFPDHGTIVLIGAMALLPCSVPVALAGAVTVGVAALTTSVVFGRDERRMFTARVLGWLDKSSDKAPPSASPR